MVIEAPVMPVPTGMTGVKIIRSVRVVDADILKEFNISRSLRLLLLNELKIGSSYLAKASNIESFR